MKEITFEEFLTRFDTSVRGKINALAKSIDTEGFILFENLQMDSSSFGEKTAVVFGLNRTYKSPEDVKDAWLRDLPSQRQYPTAFCKVNKL
jgi:hypothetical protein